MTTAISSKLSAASNSVVANTFDLQHLKIVVVSTSKTGNTWLKQLLSTIYNLPICNLSMQFQATEVDTYGERWIGHQHYSPQPELIEWAKQNQVMLITTVRHPCDVLVSLYNYVRNNSGTPTFFEEVERLLSQIRDEDAKTGLNKNLDEFLHNFFFFELGISLMWLRTGYSKIVRYEDLWCDPVATLQQLTAQICPVSLDRIERAIAECDIKMLRNLYDPQAKFFRKGGIGGWKDILSPQLVEIFEKVEPYPTIFKALGYNLDPHDPFMTRPVKPSSYQNPFSQTRHFDNGAPIPTIAIKLFFSIASSESGRWLPISRTAAADSFFGWLNAPAENDPVRYSGQPLITNLAAYLHRHHPGLQELYPDLYGQHRLDVIEWFLRYASEPYQLEQSFLAPVRASWLAWANLPADNLPDQAPLITNYAARFYRSQPHLQTLYSDLAGSNRADYADWFLRYSSQSYGVEEALLTPMRESWLVWANTPADKETYQWGELPLISNLAQWIYRLRPDQQQNFPDLYGSDRLDYIRWFLQYTQVDHALDQAEMRLVRESFIEWANRPATADPYNGTHLPIISNYAALIYAQRPDLQARFPDLYGQARLEYAVWFWVSARYEYKLDGPFLAPLALSWAKMDNLDFL